MVAAIRELGSEGVLTPEQLQAIGSIAVETTYVEHLLEFLIWKLVGIKEPTRGRYLTDRLGISQKLELVGELGGERIKYESDYKTWSGHISDLKKLVEDRNLIIHGLWLHPPEVNGVRALGADSGKAIAKRQRPRGERTFSAQDIRKVALAINQHRKAILILANAFVYRHTVSAFAEYWSWRAK